MNLTNVYDAPLKARFACGLLIVLNLFAFQSLQADSPNIVWIMAEDISTELECYGHPAVKTPHLNALAETGARYTQAFTTAPSCTPSRNAMILGVYQTRTDTQDQRRRGVSLPDGIKPITHLLREAGYYTALGCGYSGKTDLNFKSEPLFDGTDWGERAEGQPFFAQITLDFTHRYQSANWEPERARSKNPVDPAAVDLPPYFPDHEVTRMDWALYLNAIQKMDSQVGEIVQRLRDEGIIENTVIIFIGDNGRCHLRGKCWLYDAGIKVPLITSWPGNIEAGSVNHDLVSMIDISATVLDIAGVELPDYLDGHPILGARAQKRNHVFAARDLIDEIMDRIRCVRTDRFKYIRNYQPENGYMECDYVQRHRPMFSVIRELGAEGMLSPAQALILKDRKPAEELYDVVNDPHEINNLAGLPEYNAVLVNLRSRLDEWTNRTKDKGLEQHQANRPGAADPDTYLSDLSEAFEKRWPHNRTITIAVHGHSVPTGYTTKGVVDPFNAYPHLLRAELKKRYPLAVINVIVTGIGGENAVQGAQRFDRDVLALNPDLVMIDYALNDRSVGLEPARQAWTEMIEKTKASDAKLLLLTPTGDTRATMTDLYDPLSQHAIQIRSLAEEHGVGLVDSYQRFQAYAEAHGTIEPIMAQVNHPNRLGHDLVVEELMRWFPGLAEGQ